MAKLVGGGQTARRRVRKLQRGLYRAAKSNGARKSYSLNDKVWRQDVLWQAWEEVKAPDATMASMLCASLPGAPWFDALDGASAL